MTGGPMQAVPCERTVRGRSAWMIVAAAIALSGTVAIARADDWPLATVYVGVEARVKYVVPHRDGIPVLLRAPEPPRGESRHDVTIRVISRREAAGATEFELGVIAAVPGEFDISPLLSIAAPRKEDGTTYSPPPLRVNVWNLLPEDHDGLVHEHATGVRGRGAWYPWIVGAVGVVWLTPLVVLAVRRLRRPSTVAADAPPVREPTLADLLRPLVARVVAGERDPAVLGEMERVMLGFWRARLATGRLADASARDRLKHDPACAALLDAVERWLHAPEHLRPTDAEVERLLAPLGAGATLAPVERGAAEGNKAGVGLDAGQEVGAP